MKINMILFPIKIHFFMFMAAAGPVLPFITVLGKQFGISEITIGTINALLPLVYLLSKPVYGYFMDYFLKWRIFIFAFSVAVMGMFFFLMYNVSLFSNKLCEQIPQCLQDKNENISAKLCEVSCDQGSDEIHYRVLNGSNLCFISKYGICDRLDTKCLPSCIIPDVSVESSDNDFSLYSNSVFWNFVIFMSFGMVLFNICSSFSDAICFDILGEDNHMKYGLQRVWGTVGYGITALVAGYLVDKYSAGSRIKNHTPAVILLCIFITFDIFVCFLLRPPNFQKSSNILKDAMKVLRKPNISLFMLFVTLFGILDSFVIYYLFWFLEDISSITGMNNNIRSIEGLITFLQTFCGEIIFFQFSGKIVAKIGIHKCFSLCFFGYFVRLLLYSLIGSVWWALPIEAIMQGLNYAFSYSLIVTYTSEISTPGIQATMQGVTTAIYNGLGFAIGSFFGGLFYNFLGGRKTFFIFSLLALLASVLNIFIFKPVSVALEFPLTFERENETLPSSNTQLVCSKNKS